MLEPEEEEVGDELADSGTGEEVSNEPVVSLHALHGVDMPFINRKMKLIGFYKKTTICVLVDSGSTHNFLDTTMVKGVGRHEQLINTNKVMVANGDRLDCNSVCKGFEWTM